MSGRAEQANLEHKAAQAAAKVRDLMTSATRAADMVMAGRHPRQKTGRSDTFWQFRDYAHGDPVSAIDWRQSARLDQRLLVRETEWEQPQTLLLWCNGDEDFDFAGGKRETKRFRGQVISLALALMALRGGERVGLWGGIAPPQVGAHRLHDLAHALVHTDIDLVGGRPSPGASVVLVSDFHRPTDDLLKALRAITAEGGRSAIVVIEDPAEAQFPFQGSTRFEGSRGETHRFFGEAGAVRQTYLDARQRHHDALRAGLQDARETIVFHQSDQPITPLLLRLAAHLEGEQW